MFRLLNILPILFHIVLLCLFKNFRPGDVAMIELIYNSMVTPIYLLIINRPTYTMGNIIKIFAMAMVITLNIIISYVNWGIESNKLYQPDSETILVLKTEFLIGIVILIVGISIIHFIKLKK